MHSLHFIFKMSAIFEDHNIFLQLLNDFPTLQPILKKYNVNTSKIRILSSAGSHGIAFTDGYYIVKLTDDKEEAKASHKIAGQKIPGVVFIYYAGKFARETQYHDPEITNEKTQYYLIIQDLVDTKISQNEANISTLVGNWLITRAKWPFNLEASIKDFYNYTYFQSHLNLISPTNTTIIRSLLRSVQNLYNHGVKYMDVSGGNIGKDKNGELVVFDLGVSETHQPTIPISSID